MFDHCKTLDELAKKGPLERPALDQAATLLRAAGHIPDIVAMRLISEKYLHTGVIKEAVRQATKQLQS